MQRVETTQQRKDRLTIQVISRPYSVNKNHIVSFYILGIRKEKDLMYASPTEFFLIKK